MATAGELSTIRALAASKGYNIYPYPNALDSGIAGYGHFLVFSPTGKVFKANLDLSNMTNHLNAS